MKTEIFVQRKGYWDKVRERHAEKGKTNSSKKKT